MSRLSDNTVIQMHTRDDENNDFSQCIERIDMLFQRDYLQQGGELPAIWTPFFLPAYEIDLRLEFPTGMPVWTGLPGTHLPGTPEFLTQRLQTLMDSFELTSCERDILLLALLPRLSDHYLILPDSELKNGINEHVLTRLLGSTHMEYRILQSALHPSSPLRRFFLLSEEKRGENNPLSPRYAVSDSVWHFFCGNNSLVTYRHPYVCRAETDNSAWYSVDLHKDIVELSLQLEGGVPPVVVLEGHELDGRERMLANIFDAYERPLLCVDVGGLASLADTQLPLNMAEIVRDAVLDNAALVLENCIELAAANSDIVRILERLLTQVELPVFILSENTADIPVFSKLPCVHISVPEPTTASRAQLLQMAWPDRLDEEQVSALLGLAACYVFNPADVSLLMQEADYYRQIRSQDASLSIEDLRQTLARRSRKNFGKLAQRITPMRTFEDIALSPALKSQLGEIVATIRLRESVTEKHFGRKIGGKTGVSALFHGESGTGKTLAAEVLAQYLGVDLIKVDLSTVVNKYVGETEKNLSRIFDLAQADSGVLFFDEADALFGKRSEAKDAHDRHANIEVSYLLQRLESYPGLVILATNNRSHLDSAFNRRFTFITRFTYPDASVREQMWQSIWPSTLKLADDIDFKALATKSELTGANIRNVAMQAAILAEEEGSPEIYLHHIDHAVSRELSKLGRLSL